MRPQVYVNCRFPETPRTSFGPSQLGTADGATQDHSADFMSLLTCVQSISESTENGTKTQVYSAAKQILKFTHNFLKIQTFVSLLKTPLRHGFKNIYIFEPKQTYLFEVSLSQEFYLQI